MYISDTVKRQEPEPDKNVLGIDRDLERHRFTSFWVSAPSTPAAPRREHKASRATRLGRPSTDTPKAADSFLGPSVQLRTPGRISADSLSTGGRCRPRRGRRNDRRS